MTPRTTRTTTAQSAAVSTPAERNHHTMSPTARKTATTAPTIAEDGATKATQKKLAEARTAALGRLLEENRERFNEIMAEEAAKREVTWKRKLTQEEKDVAALEALLKKNPALAQRAVELAGVKEPAAGTDQNVDPDGNTDLS